MIKHFTTIIAIVGVFLGSCTDNSNPTQFGEIRSEESAVVSNADYNIDIQFPGKVYSGVPSTYQWKIKNNTGSPVDLWVVISVYDYDFILGEFVFVSNWKDYHVGTLNNGATLLGSFNKTFHGVNYNGWMVRAWFITKGVNGGTNWRKVGFKYKNVIVM